LFFTAATPQTVVDACHVKLQDESYLAFLDVLAPSRPRPTRQRAPMLVLGAARDGIIAAAHVHRTARAYGTRAEIFDGMGHDMMLEPGWQRVADRIDAWVS
jgi:alpha-beta hydrolase superfamily lysophospholipase